MKRTGAVAVFVTGALAGGCYPQGFVEGREWSALMHGHGNAPGQGADIPLEAATGRASSLVVGVGFYDPEFDPVFGYDYGGYFEDISVLYRQYSGSTDVACAFWELGLSTGTSVEEGAFDASSGPNILLGGGVRFRLDNFCFDLSLGVLAGAATADQALVPGFAYAWTFGGSGGYGRTYPSASSFDYTETRREAKAAVVRRAREAKLDAARRSE